MSSKFKKCVASVAALSAIARQYKQINGAISSPTLRILGILRVNARMNQCQKDYSGQTLIIINTHAVPVMGEPTALHAEQFAALTGAEVNVIHTPAGDLYSKRWFLFKQVRRHTISCLVF